jgi:hypothetical protein
VNLQELDVAFASLRVLSFSTAEPTAVPGLLRRHCPGAAELLGTGQVRSVVRLRASSRLLDMRVQPTGHARFLPAPLGEPPRPHVARYPRCHASRPSYSFSSISQCRGPLRQFHAHRALAEVDAPPTQAGLQLEVTFEEPTSRVPTTFITTTARVIASALLAGLVNVLTDTRSAINPVDALLRAWPREASQNVSSPR